MRPGLHVDATSFELNVSLPVDARFAHTMRDLATHAARYAGCAGEDADTYGSVVEAAVLGCLSTMAGAGAVPVIVRRGRGPVEFLIACEQRFAAIALKDRHIRIGWTREAGQQMCCVARLMPPVL